MPTPLGHAVGGAAAAFIASASWKQPVLRPAVAIAAIGAAMSPDLDILLGSHRTYTHSVGAVVVVGFTTWLFARGRIPAAPTAATAVAAAYASHLLLDWLGKDTSRPPGLKMLWPFSGEFHMSGLNVFGEVSRRYWLPGEFVLGNLKALGWEMTVLLPVLVVAWVVWSGRTLVHTPSPD